MYSLCQRSFLNTKSYIIVLLLMLASKSMLASSCCGGSSSLPNLITSDQKAIVSGSISRERLVGEDNGATGLYRFKKFNKEELRHLFSLKSSYLMSEYWQAGFVLNTVYNTNGVGEGSFRESFHFGDITANLAYEFLPETTYSPYKPRGFVYMKMIFPTGKSIYEVIDPLDVSGQGHYQSAFGLAFFKYVNWGDVSFFAETTNKWARKQNDRLLNPAYSTKLLMDIGYQFTPTMRGGVSIAHNYQFSYNVGSRLIPSSYHWDLSFSFNHLLGNGYSLGLTYMDQTVIGPAKLDPLNRSVTFLVAKAFSL